MDSYVLETDLSSGQVIHAFLDHIHKERYSMLIGQKRCRALTRAAGVLVERWYMLSYHLLTRFGLD